MTQWPGMNLSSGPVEVSEQTRRAMSRPVLYHYDPAFIDCFAHTCDLVQRVFQTRYDVVIMQGEAVLGLEAAAAALVAPGDTALNLVSGVFGKWFGTLIERYGGELIEVEVPYNEAINPEDVRRALRAHPEIKLLSVVHSETPSGTVNPVREIGAIAREFEVLTVVDTVSGLGGDPFVPEEWGVDLAVAGPQKCLSGPPGLSLLSVSPAAWTAMERREKPLRGSFLSILDWKEAWLEQRRFPATPSVSEIYALESTLSQVLDEGMPAYNRRHAAIARACRAGVEALGLRLWPARPEIAASCVTAVLAPDGLDETALRERMRQSFGVTISGGFGDLAGRLFRLGHMGIGAHPYHLAAQLAILERSLADLGHPVAFGTGVGAALAALGDWDEVAAPSPADRTLAAVR